MSNLRTLNRIKKEFDYKSYCDDNYNIKTTNREDEFRLNCFVCGDNDYKLYVNPVKNKFNCFKCNFSSGTHDVFDFVAITEGISRGKAVLKLVQEFRPITPDVLDLEDEDEVPFIRYLPIKTIDSLPSFAKPLTIRNVEQDKYWEYLINRGLTVEEVLACKIHYADNMNSWIYNENRKCVGNLYNRVIFPVYGPNGKLVSWLGRHIEDDGPQKYLNCPNSDLSKTIWPFIIPSTDTAIIVEGILDNVSVRRHKQDVYTTFGKHISPEQIKILRDWGVINIILLWDIRDAKKEIMSAAEKLKLQFEVHVPNFTDWPKGVDAGDLLDMRTELSSVILGKALDKPIHTSSLEYVAWQILN